MPIAQPSSSSPLNNPDHSALHRIIAANPTAAVETITVSADTSIDLNGAINFQYRAITALRTLDATDWTVDCTANTFNVTLPDATTVPGRVYNIKNSGTGVITVVTTSAQTIDGVSSVTLNSSPGMYPVLTVQSTGTNWIVL